MKIPKESTPRLIMSIGVILLWDGLDKLWGFGVACTVVGCVLICGTAAYSVWCGTYSYERYATRSRTQRAPAGKEHATK